MPGETPTTPPDPEQAATPAQGVPKLALNSKEACRALGIGERLLWQLTNTNRIPHVRIGQKKVLYPVKELEAWLAKGGAR